MEKRQSTEERFWSKVKKTRGCWVWTATTTLGYGKFGLNGKQMMAHRWAYETLVGRVPEGLVLDHICRNRACVRPKHLRPLTPRENVLIGVGAPAMNSRKTICRRGHKLNGSNLIKTARKERRCKICSRDAMRKYRNFKMYRLRPNSSAMRMKMNSQQPAMIARTLDMIDDRDLLQIPRILNAFLLHHLIEKPTKALSEIEKLGESE